MEAPIKSIFEGGGLQAVRKGRKIIAALAAEGLRYNLIRVSLTLFSGLFSRRLKECLDVLLG
jgi:hypothetical protein